LAVQRDAFAQCVGDHLQIGPLHRWPQIADRSRTTPAIARGELVVADALLNGAIEVIVARKAETECALYEGFADRIVAVHVGHAEGSTGAVQLARTARLVLGAAEIR